MDTSEWVALAVGLTASVTDLRHRRIPNALTFGAAAVALGFHAATGGLSGAGISVAGWAAGVALFFPLFALGGMGAGDVKLLAALGAWLGPYQALWIALYGSIAGGILAVVVALAQGYLRSAVTNLGALLFYWRVAGIRPHPELVLDRAGSPRMAFAVPITAGVVLAIWFR